MNSWIMIARESVSLTGHKTIEKIETVRREEGLKKLAGKNIVRRFSSPFNSSVEVVVIG